jgi:hypothetical protein
MARFAEQTPERVSS